MSDYFLLYNDATSTTGRELGQWLSDHGLDIESGHSTRDIRYRGLIRWGCTAKANKKPEKVLNWQAAINSASQKLDSLLLMKDQGLLVPDIYTPSSPDIQFPVYGRAPQHTGGTDIVLCLQKRDLAIAADKGCTYFTRLIPTDREFRVHVFGDKIIKISEKVLTNPDLWQPHIRNLSTGYTFRQPDERPGARVRYAAVAAVDVHKLHFGAVDIVVGDDGHPYILEVNTAPGLTTDSSLEAYGTRILEEFA